MSSVLQEADHVRLSGWLLGRISSVFGPVELEERVKELEAENLYLKEELDRARLALGGAHSSMRAADAMAGSAGHGGSSVSTVDEMDDILAVQLETLATRTELLRLISLFKESLTGYEKRLDTGASISDSPTAAVGREQDREVDGGGLYGSERSYVQRQLTTDRKLTIQLSPLTTEAIRLLRQGMVDKKNNQATSTPPDAEPCSTNIIVNARRSLPR